MELIVQSNILSEELFVPKRVEQSNLFLYPKIESGTLFMPVVIGEEPDEEIYTADTILLTADTTLYTADYVLGGGVIEIIPVDFSDEDNSMFVLLLF